MRISVPLAAAALPVYVFGVRPWMMRWGSTEPERTASLAGDEVIPRAALSVTRAVEIGAPPSEVWPWLVQLGYGPDRAGFYSYDWLERLARLDVRSASRVVPELQHIAVGDHIPLGPETELLVERVDAEAALVLHARMHPITGRSVDPRDDSAPLWLDWTWTFVLRPRGGSTRLLVRTRVEWSRRLLGHLMQPALEPVWFLMERRMLLGIRDRARSADRR